MASKRLTDKQMDEILDSLSGMEKAEPRPFFYTRLQARMAAETDPSPWGKAMAILSRPVVALATLVIFLLVNGFILFNKFERKTTVTEESYQALAMEYSEMNSPFYETTENR